MNALNRTFVAATAILTALLCILVVYTVTSKGTEIQAQPVAHPLDGFAVPEPMPVTTWAQDQAQTLRDLTPKDKAAITGLCILIALAAAVLLYFELKTLRAPPAYLLIKASEEGITTISTHSVEALAINTALNNRNVRAILCRVTQTGNNHPDGPNIVQIRCLPTLRMASDIPATATDLQTRIKAMVEEATGLEVQAVNIARTRYERLQKGRLLDGPKGADL